MTRKKSKTNQRKWLWTTVIIGFAFLMVIAVVLYVNRHRYFHPVLDASLAAYPVQGVDISSHNGEVDFEKLVSTGVRFVIIKATEGGSYRDRKFAQNLARAREQGLKVGAYHFFRKGRAGDSQARHFLSVIGGIELDLPPIIDVEDWGNDKRVEDATANANLAAMVAEMQSAGVQPMIYTNGDGMKKYYSGRYEHLPLWLCSFTAPDSIGAQAHHVLQQYSHWGNVDGIEGEVDLNVFMGSESEWEQWLEQVK